MVKKAQIEVTENGFTQTAYGWETVKKEVEKKVSLYGNNGKELATKWQIAQAIIEEELNKQDIIDRFIMIPKKNSPNGETTLPRNAETALASQLNYLRMGYFFPIILDVTTGIYSLLNEDQYFEFTQWKQSQTPKKSVRKRKAPAIIVNDAIKRMHRTEKALEKAHKIQESDDSDLADLKVQKAEIDNKIAIILYNEIVDKYSEIDIDDIENEIKKVIEQKEQEEVEVTEEVV